jgi:hypothetical protein
MRNRRRKKLSDETGEIERGTPFRADREQGTGARRTKMLSAEEN